MPPGEHSLSIEDRARYLSLNGWGEDRLELCFRGRQRTESGVVVEEDIDGNFVVGFDGEIGGDPVLAAVGVRTDTFQFRGGLIELPLSLSRNGSALGGLLRFNRDRFSLDIYGGAPIGTSWREGGLQEPAWGDRFFVGAFLMVHDRRDRVRFGVGYDQEFTTADGVGVDAGRLRVNLEGRPSSRLVLYTDGSLFLGQNEEGEFGYDGWGAGAGLMVRISDELSLRAGYEGGEEPIPELLGFPASLEEGHRGELSLNYGGPVDVAATVSVNTENLWAMASLAWEHGGGTLSSSVIYGREHDSEEQEVMGTLAYLLRRDFNSTELSAMLRATAVYQEEEGISFGAGFSFNLAILGFLLVGGSLTYLRLPNGENEIAASVNVAISVDRPRPAHAEAQRRESVVEEVADRLRDVYRWLEDQIPWRTQNRLVHEGHRPRLGADPNCSMCHSSREGENLIRVTDETIGRSCACHSSALPQENPMNITDVLGRLGERGHVAGNIRGHECEECHDGWRLSRPGREPFNIRADWHPSGENWIRPEHGERYLRDREGEPCLVCHESGIVRFQGARGVEQVQTCDQCHVEHHPQGEDWWMTGHVAEARMGESGCRDCHDSQMPFEGRALLTCRSCHGEEGPPNHRDGTWMASHQLERRMDCNAAGCHRPPANPSDGMCASCHGDTQRRGNMVRPHGEYTAANFDRHQTDGAGRMVYCAQCHDGPNGIPPSGSVPEMSCTRCHESSEVGGEGR